MYKDLEEEKKQWKKYKEDCKAMKRKLTSLEGKVEGKEKRCETRETSQCKWSEQKKQDPTSITYIIRKGKSAKLFLRYYSIVLILKHMDDKGGCGSYAYC